jgi:hypothetical protein
MPAELRLSPGVRIPVSVPGFGYQGAGEGSNKEGNSLKVKRKYEHVYQFKIALEGIEPPVWRRIQVPRTYTFWDLHVAIQDSMGWRDSHLHQFTIKNPSTGVMDLIGIPDEDLQEELEVLPGWKKKVADYFLNAGGSAR